MYYNVVYHGQNYTKEFQKFFILNLFCCLIFGTYSVDSDDVVVNVFWCLISLQDSLVQIVLQTELLLGRPSCPVEVVHSHSS